MKARLKRGYVCAALMSAVGCFVIFAANGSAQQAAATGVAEVERVIVTGSNIPTAEEVGPNPVDTYRPLDIEKLGVRNATDFLTRLPQEMGATLSQNTSNIPIGIGDGTVQVNLRGLMPRETLVLIDGKRVAGASLSGNGAIDINLIPFSMIDHIDILKDGASAVYGADAVAGVVNFFLVHKFRGLEIGGTYGNTNLGASNEMGEWEGWLKAGTGDDKTDIVVIADFWERLGGMFSRDRDISSNGNFRRFGGFDIRSGTFPGRVQGFRLLPGMFFGPGGTPLPGVNTPIAHSATGPGTSPFYTTPGSVPGIQNSVLGDGDYVAYNFAAVTANLPPADRQTFYGSFTRDLCDKYLTVFCRFKYTRSFFDTFLAAVPIGLAGSDPFQNPDGTSFSPAGISVPIRNAFNPFTVGDTTLVINGVPVPMTTGVRFRGINDTGARHEKFTYWDTLFDVGLKGEMGEFGDYFKTWNWELGFRYSRNEGQDLSVGEASKPGLRDALLDTDPATAFDPFLNINAQNSKAARARSYVALHNSGEDELPLGYVNINGDLFKLPAGPVSFAIGGDYYGDRFTRDRDALNNTFSSIGSVDGASFRANRDVWEIYEEVRVPFTSPTWNFPGFYSFEVDFAEREEWYSNNTSTVLPSGLFPEVPAFHSTYNAQKPKVSVRWQPIDPKYIGAVTLRGSYTEAFHAPALSEISPASTGGPIGIRDPLLQFFYGAEGRTLGNPNLQPEVAYEWSYGAVYSPKWIKGLTLSADWWHIDMRSITSLLGFQFIVNNDIPGLVIRGPPTNPGEPGRILVVIDPNKNLSGAIFEGLDYEATYILDSSIFGHGDFGKLTATLNATWLSRAELQILPDTKRFGIAGEVIPPGFTLTGSLPWSCANCSLFYDGPADTWMQGLDIGAVAHYTGQYEDDNVSLTQSFFTGELAKPQTPRSGPLSWRARKVREWITLDLIASYTFNLPPPA